jgi:hypothetical protein
MSSKAAVNQNYPYIGHQAGQLADMRIRRRSVTVQDDANADRRGQRPIRSPLECKASPNP